MLAYITLTLLTLYTCTRVCDCVCVFICVRTRMYVTMYNCIIIMYIVYIQHSLDGQYNTYFGHHCFGGGGLELPAWGLVRGILILRLIYLIHLGLTRSNSSI